MIKKLFLGLIILFSITAPARAQIFLEQGKVVHKASPGETITGTLQVNNTSNEALTVKIYWEDFQYEPPYDGGKEFLPMGTSKDSLGLWARFSPQELELPAFGRKDISYVINIPPDVVGGYYGVLFFEKGKKDFNAQTGLNIVTRVGSLFFIELSNSVRKISLEGAQFSGNTFTGKLTNEGNVIAIPESVYYIMDGQGLVVDRGTVKNVYLPPGASVDYAFDISSDLAGGAYSMVLTLDLGGGDVFVKEIDFSKTADKNYSITRTSD